MSDRVSTLKALLDARRSELFSALRSTRRGSRETLPFPGGWSVAMVLEHLVQTETAVTKLLASFAENASPRSPAENFDADAFSKRLEMPAFLDRTRRLRLSQPTGSVPASAAWEALKTSREALLEVLERSAGHRLEDMSRDHPAGGKLDGYQWVAFMGLHEARHAAQIMEIESQLQAAQAPEG